MPALAASVLLGAGTASGAVATLAAPATLVARLEPPPSGPQAGRPAPVLELELGCSVAATGVALRVFLDEPATDARPASTRPGYVGALGLFGADPPACVAGRGRRFALPLGEVLERLARAGRHPLRDGYPAVTVVLIPVGSGEPLAGASVEVDAAVIGWR